MTGYVNDIPSSTWSANQRWQEYAEALGFATENEMLVTLCGSLKTNAIADLIGVTTATIRNRMKYHSIQRKPNGGKNHVREKKLINGDIHRKCSKCEQWHAGIGYCKQCQQKYIKNWKLKRTYAYEMF